MKKSSTILVSSLFLFILAVGSVKAQAVYVGIPSGTMDYYAAQQQNSQWCWAAAIQMVLNGYGVNINQEQIVARTYGRDPYGNLPNWPGSFQAIHRNLNNWGVDNSGQGYRVSASIGMGAPTPSLLISELSMGRPVIIGYRTGGNSGHAVVVTAVSYVNGYNGPVIMSIVVRDPWPSQSNINNRGKIEYPGAVLANNIQAHWYIRVSQAY